MKKLILVFLLPNLVACGASKPASPKVTEQTVPPQEHQPPSPDTPPKADSPKGSMDSNSAPVSTPAYSPHTAPAPAPVMNHPTLELGQMDASFATKVFKSEDLKGPIRPIVRLAEMDSAGRLLVMVNWENSLTRKRVTQFVRFDKDLKVDSGFGENGVLTLSLPSDLTAGDTNFEINQFTIGPDKSLFILGRFKNTDQLFVVNIAENGRLEQNFLERGFLRLPLDPVTGVHRTSIVKTDSGLFVQKRGTRPLIRIVAPGKVDESFGDAVSSALLSVEVLSLRTNARQELLAAISDFKRLSLARIGPDGAVLSRTPLTDTLLYEDFVDYPVKIAVHPDGSAYVAFKHRDQYRQDEPSVRRVLDDGKLDADFKWRPNASTASSGGSGYTLSPLSDGTMTALPGGSIAWAGQWTPGSIEKLQPAILLFKKNGQPVTKGNGSIAGLISTKDMHVDRVDSYQPTGVTFAAEGFVYSINTMRTGDFKDALLVTRVRGL